MHDMMMCPKYSIYFEGLKSELTIRETLFQDQLIRLNRTLIENVQNN